MDETTQDESQVLETETTDPEAVDETTETSTEETPDEKIARLEKEKAELDSKNKQLFERAKKAEQNKVDGLTADDIIALTGIPAEDRERVKKWATQTGTSVSDALADPDLKIILDTRAEERRTAAATSTGSGRGSSKVSGEQLLERAERTGEVPDTDEGMAALAAARLARLTRKKEQRT